jgi:hypothetical protein
MDCGLIDAIEGIWLVLESMALQCKPKVGENEDRQRVDVTCLRDVKCGSENPALVNIVTYP